MIKKGLCDMHQLAGIAILFMLCIMTHSLRAETIQLTKNGQSSYKIVIPEHPDKLYQYAAAELQLFIKQISTAQLPIITAEHNSSNYEIILGNNAHLVQLDHNIDFDKLNKEGFTIRTLDHRLIIAANTPRGTLYGVYTFLEEYLGCRWYSSAVSNIPNTPTIKLNDINTTQIPVINYREVYYSDPMDSTFAGRLKLNGNASTIIDNRLVAERHAGWATWCHTSFTFVPPHIYYQDHPEYFALNKEGKRQTTQLCWTNPDIFNIVANKIRNMSDKPIGFTPNSNLPASAQKLPIWAEKENTYIDISQQDHYGACECETCRAIDKHEGSRIGSVLTFVNRIANEFPDKTFSTLSYVYTRTPPEHIKPAPNVSIMLCNFESSRTIPLVNSPFGSDTSFMRDVKTWSDISHQLFIWDYIVNFSHLYMPNPNLFIQKDNINFYIDHNVNGIFAQGSREAGGEFCELRNYLIAKLLWNPNANVDAIIDDFLNGYYGPAGKTIRQYIDLMSDYCVKNEVWLGIYDSPQKHRDDYLSQEMVNKYNALFDHAEKQVQNTPDILHRVRTARMPLMYATIMNRYGSPLDRLNTLETFHNLCQKNNIKKLSEMGNTPDEFYQTQYQQIQQELGVRITPQHALFSSFENATATMTTIQPNAQIRYTLDGTEPDENSTLYTQPVKITHPTTIKASCFGEKSTPTTTAVFQGISLPLESSIMTKGQSAQFIKLNVSTAKILKLFVLDADQSINCDHGDWADAKLIDSNGQTTWLSNLTPVKTSQGWSKLGINTNIEGDPLNIAETTYPHGLGTHANSQIIFNLNKKYQWLETYIGVDQAACDNASVIFKIEIEK